MLRTLLAGIRTFVLVPLFFLLTLVFATVIIIFGIFRPGASIHDKILYVWSGLFLKIPPVRIEVSGVEKVDPNQRYVVVSNHLSMFDVPLLMHELPIQGRYLAKKEVFKIPLVAQAMRAVGIIEINRQKGGSSRQAIIEGVRIATERGYSLLVYPEGTRNTKGTLLPFYKGAFRIAIDTGLPILPVVIEGTERVSRPGSKFFYPGHATMRILDPVETTGMTNKEDLRTLTAQVESDMNAVYREMRLTTDDKQGPTSEDRHPK
jgi:1-acyl-sn-glycerol-3-phosphate acyltransferase